MLTHQVSSGVMTRVALPGCPLDLVPVGCSSTTYIDDDYYLIGLLCANMLDMLYVTVCTHLTCHVVSWWLYSTVRVHSYHYLLRGSPQVICFNVNCILADSVTRRFNMGSMQVSFLDPQEAMAAILLIYGCLCWWAGLLGTVN